MAVDNRKWPTLVAVAIVLAVVGLATVVNADEDRDGRDRGDHGPIKALLNLGAKINIEAPDLKFNLQSDNDIRVNGATVSAVSSSGFTATSMAPALTFNVQTGSDTKFQIKGKGRGSLADIAVGDIVVFRGVALSGTTTSTITLKATVVEDKTGQPRGEKPHATTTPSSIKGIVSSISTTANSFVVVGKSGTTTVSVSNSTSIRDEDGNTLTLTGIVVGSEVKVFGTSTGANAFAATKVVVDLDGNKDERDLAVRIIARLEALIASLKLRFGL